MPIFYLHYRKVDQIISDSEGSELPDLAAAEAEAMRAARELMSFEVIRGELILDQSIEIQSSDGLLLSSILFADALAIRISLGSTTRGSRIQPSASPKLAM